MARADWFDESKDLPVIDEQVQKLEHFVSAMTDGVVAPGELAQQQASLVEAMKAVEGKLDDDQHALVTRLMVELSAYNIMRLLSELQAARIERFAQAD